MTNISIVIPCYNEEKNLPGLIKNIKETVSKAPESVRLEFILVENGSLDGSKEVLSAFTETDFLKVVFVAKNQGYGFGIKTGIDRATGDYIGWMHGDCQTSAEDILAFAEIAHQYGDKPVFLKGKRCGRSLIERLFTGGMSAMGTMIFRRKMFEIMSTPVLMSKELLDPRDLLPDDFSIDIFVYYKACLGKYFIQHVPTFVHKRGGGKSSWNTGLWSRIQTSKKMLQSMFRIRHEKHTILERSSGF